MTNSSACVVTIPDPEKWMRIVAGISEPIETVARILEAGGVALLPTDTVYGLACHPDHSEAADRIYALKRRPQSAKLPVLMGSKKTPVMLWLELPERAEKLLESRYMPGALTLVLGTDPWRSVSWLKWREEVAIRIPDHEWLRSLLGRTGPLLATSANAHGMPTPETINPILAQLGWSPDIIVDGGSIGVIPSTIVNCRKTPIAIEREWIVTASEIMKIAID